MHPIKSTIKQYGIITQTNGMKKLSYFSIWVRRSFHRCADNWYLYLIAINSAIKLIFFTISIPNNIYWVACRLNLFIQIRTKFFSVKTKCSKYTMYAPCQSSQYFILYILRSIKYKQHRHEINLFVFYLLWFIVDCRVWKQFDFVHAHTISAIKTCAVQ